MIHKLTLTEKLVFKLLRKETPQKEIAAELSMAHKTVKFHCTNIYRKLQVSGRDELNKKFDFKPSEKEHSTFLPTGQ